MTMLLDWIGRRLVLWITASALLALGSMWFIAAIYRAPAGEEQPKVTDWMQAWGGVFGVIAGLAAALAATALLLHERAAAQDARQQLADEMERNSNKERIASIEVRSEQYRKIRGDRVDEGQRFVVKNHGPAEAHLVEVTFFSGGEPVEPLFRGVNPRPNTPLLHVGEELHMNYMLPWGQTPPEQVVVTWRDGRSEGQSQEFYPSHRDL
ncbi:hypothetical protein OHA01_11580 [Micromonospora zamorensis]|uniref:hypothetical protein n=1 Tax=Micromonospora zamorensis TaxID=709883 RepID=UPI00386BDCF5|nr:hypothetical protein OHA01_11580 [Micromonospora zamorensis]